ncbi:MAG: hypothetical protein HYS55_02295 [Candidatus Omnitrophica bacterium]|nr:hypothetical protein [Candidatus Omnitrophota bacterium]
MNGVPHFLYLILDEAHGGKWNMAVDERLLRSQIQAKDLSVILRFYRFDAPVMTVGYGIWRNLVTVPGTAVPGSQNPARNVPGTVMIRRLTGGGIVRHNGTDLTYSLVASMEQYPIIRKARESYQVIHEALKKALECFGVQTELFQADCQKRGQVHQADSVPVPCSSLNKNLYCFESPVCFDVMLGGKKIAGAGQKRSFGYLLQQGSIVWDALIQNQPDLSEINFCKRFAYELSQLFRLPIKETPFHAEELKEVESFV